MISIVFTTTERTPRNGHCERTVKAWRIKRNTLHYIGTMTETYMHSAQIVMHLLKKHKALPARCFEPGERNEFKHGTVSLRDEGIANIVEI